MKHLLFPSLFFLILLFCVCPTHSVVNQYVEDFTTTTYRNWFFTKAWWDTSEGELKLFSLDMTSAGVYNSPGSARDVVISGDRAYFADGSSGLYILDISDPTAPSYVGSYNTPSTAYGLDVAGDHAFVADGSAGITVVNISNPSSPTQVGNYNTPGYGYDVVVVGDYAYLADGSAGLRVFDISSPASPTPAGLVPSSSSARGVAVAGNHAFVADFNAGLKVVDITDPTSPTLAGIYDTNGSAMRVAVAGNYAFVADNATGLKVIDITDPTSPFLAGSYDTPNYAVNVFASGDFVYVADGYSGLQRISISNPSIPVLTDSYDTPDYAYGVVVDGEHAFVTDGQSGLLVVAVRELISPIQLGIHESGWLAYGTTEVDGDLAYAMGDYSLNVFDVQNPADPQWQGAAYVSHIYTDMAVDGDVAYVVGHDSTLIVLDVEDAANPSVIGFYQSPYYYTHEMCVEGDYLYVAVRWDGVEIIDISDPTNPTGVGNFDIADRWCGVEVDGDYAYIVGEPVFVILDITDPTSPTQVGSYAITGWHEAIAVAGGMAYVTNRSAGGLQVIDVSNPTNPTLVGSGPGTDSSEHIALAGNYAFVAGNQSMRVLDISDPTNPVDVYSVTTGTAFASGLSLSGDIAYIPAAQEVRPGYIYTVHAFASHYQWDRNIGQSWLINQSPDTLLAARVTSTQTERIDWELSADGGGHWQAAPNNEWIHFDYPGDGLLWRSIHLREQAHVNPTCSHLELKWLYDFANIDAVTDVPHDQGGWVRIHISRSAFDFANEMQYPIAMYNVWQRVDDMVTLEALPAEKGVKKEQPTLTSGRGGLERGIQGLPVVERDGRYFFVSNRENVASGFPEGTWEIVGSFAATQDESYLYRAPTLADSSQSGTVYSVYVISAHTTTPSVWYVSHADSGYSVDNLGPTVPRGLAGHQEVAPDGLRLTWDPNTEVDLSHYAVYRGLSENFVPTPGNRIASPSDTTSFDGGWSWDSGYYYKVSALDIHGNESLYAMLTPDLVVNVESGPAPLADFLAQNWPNPFNPVTKVAFGLTEASDASLEIYDAAGKLVRVLVNERLEANRYERTWDGRDNEGQPVASGVYFYRLKAGTKVLTRKMVLLK